ncbi:putative quinol monooxygenase [Inconstantimicrobium mannanitabidum]|uniref:Uncharacterized protein n=1 Tax=Inconstantimicrobium mannanitabidum TaxID=1604901 RepID=A0ACB5RED7_9CLOT|nr:antibiotic biosynthesis monooxygenase [Clostridium sp. TW13]GKX67408.1 hypothetical protein rsdtw13_26660 [Clostridium sp. TW13]
MILKNVTFYIKPDYINKFIDATIENQKSSLLESGVESFDFLQCQNDPTIFILNEGYKSEEDLNKHLETDHFKKWMNEVEKYFAKEREKVNYIPVSEIKKD